MLAQEPDIAVAAECSSGREAIGAIIAHRPDLLFLDIQMPGVNGFEVLRALPSKGLPVVIFTTAYDEHALEAFEIHALDYLLKPFKAARFKDALQRAREHLQNRNAGDTNARMLALLERFRTVRTYTTRFVIKSASRVVIVKKDSCDGGSPNLYANSQSSMGGSPPSRGVIKMNLDRDVKQMSQIALMR